MAKRRRKKKPGTIQEAQALLWRALEGAAELLDAEDLDANTRLRLLHGLAQGVGAYARVVEVSDIEARLEALEAEKEAGEDGPRLSVGGAA